jgi:hypothetical protein
MSDPLSVLLLCAGGSKPSLAESAARKAARDASSLSWALLGALGLLLLLLWAKLLPHLPWLQEELRKWHSLGGTGAANARPT